MTIKEIQVAQDKNNIQFETAKKIRQLLDDAKKSYGSEWLDDDIENKIIELATGE